MRGRNQAPANGCRRFELVVVLRRQPISMRGHTVVGAVLAGVDAGMECIGPGGMQGIATPPSSEQRYHLEKSPPPSARSDVRFGSEADVA